MEGWHLVVLGRCFGQAVEVVPPRRTLLETRPDNLGGGVRFAGRLVALVVFEVSHGAALPGKQGLALLEASAASDRRCACASGG